MQLLIRRQCGDHMKTYCYLFVNNWWWTIQKFGVVIIGYNSVQTLFYMLEIITVMTPWNSWEFWGIIHQLNSAQKNNNYLFKTILYEW